MSTLKELRRKLARIFREPFFLDIPDGYINPQGGELVGNTSLWARANFWKFSWVYAATGANAGLERRITSYNENTGVITVSPPFTSAFDDTDEIEIHSRISGTEKNEAINKLIREGWPQFYSIEEREIVIPKDVTEIRSDTSDNWPTDWKRLLTADLEPYTSHLSEEMSPTFTAHSGGTSRFGFSGKTWTDDLVGARLATIAGPGTGYEAEITAVDGNELHTATDDWPTLPTGNSIMIVKGARKTGRWLGLDDVWPVEDRVLTSIMLPRWLQHYAGRTIRFRGWKEPVELASETATTDIPDSYILNGAASHLAVRMQVDGASHSVDDYQWLARWDGQDMRELKRALAWEPPMFTNWKRNERTAYQIPGPW